MSDFNSIYDVIANAAKRLRELSEEGLPEKDSVIDQSVIDQKIIDEIQRQVTNRVYQNFGKFNVSFGVVKASVKNGIDDALLMIRKHNE